VRKVSLDPNLELADANIKNSSFPKTDTKSIIE